MHSPASSVAPFSTPPTNLSLKGVSFRRGQTEIFRELSLELRESRIGLIGDNGAGKSSLMRLLCGLDKPQTGTVEMGGVSLDSGGRPAPDQPRPVGMMFQNPDDQIVFPTVAEELALSLSAQGMAKAEVSARVHAFLLDRGLSHWSQRAISSLSQGQRQQVCWLAMIIADHPVLLLDEPYASLDMPGQAALSAQIAQSSAQIILSTHALQHVRDFPRVIWLDQGRVRGDGPGQTVCSAYEEHVHARIRETNLAAGNAP